MVTALHSNQAVKGFACASGETTLTDSSANFHTYMVGWQIIVDMEFPVALTITARPSATTLKVAGDVRTLTDPGKFYILFAPPWVNPANGTLAEVITEGEDAQWDVLTKGSLFLWAGYRYQPPMVGFNDGGTTVGAQTGGNKLGNYHCNNRVYSIGAGRWLSPDQAASPFFVLSGYSTSPAQYADLTGLNDKTPGGGGAGDTVPTPTPEQADWLGKQTPWGETEQKVSDEYWARRKKARAAIERVWGLKAPIEKRNRLKRRIYGADNGFKNKIDVPGVISFPIHSLDEARALAKGGQGSCWEELSIDAHGSPYSFTFSGADQCWETNPVETPSSRVKVMTATELGTVLRPRMCRDKCIIKIQSCNVGLGSIPQEIANATGCEVRAMKGYGRVGENFERGCSSRPLK